MRGWPTCCRRYRKLLESILRENVRASPGDTLFYNWFTVHTLFYVRDMVKTAGSGRVLFYNASWEFSVSHNLVHYRKDWITQTYLANLLVTNVQASLGGCTARIGYFSHFLFLVKMLICMKLHSLNELIYRILEPITYHVACTVKLVNSSCKFMLLI